MKSNRNNPTASAVGFKFGEDDLAMVHFVYELRLATIEHVANLTGRSYKRVQERLDKLVRRDYLRLVRRRPHKHVYAVGREGIAALVEHGLAPRELELKRLREHELKDLGIRHAIFIADIHAKLIQMTQARSLTITKWVEGPPLFDRVTTSANVTIPIRPDAFFTITWPDGKGRSHFFLEADRGSMAHSRMREKAEGYAAYFHQQLHMKKYPGMKTFKVVTVTETRGRAESLTAEFRSMMSEAWLAAYPVVAFEDLTLDGLLPGVAHSASA